MDILKDAVGCLLGLDAQILFVFFILLNYCLNSKGQKGENTYPAIANFFLMEYFYYRLLPVILDKFIL